MSYKKFQEYSSVTSASHLMRSVFAWMSVALTISATMAYAIASTPAVISFLFSNMFVPIGLLIAQLGLVIFLSRSLGTMKSSTATLAFLLFSVVTGITLSTIFLTYAHALIFTSFFITAAMFGTMCLYGYFTRNDLSSLGSVLTMGLFGLIIAMLVNLFLQSSMFEYVISIIGVVLFTALTAYDIQKIKQLSRTVSMDNETSHKISIMGALTLYLDFINLFLMVLRLLSNNRRN